MAKGSGGGGGSGKRTVDFKASGTTVNRVFKRSSLSGSGVDHYVFTRNGRSETVSIQRYGIGLKRSAGDTLRMALEELGRNNGVSFTNTPARVNSSRQEWVAKAFRQP